MFKFNFSNDELNEENDKVSFVTNQEKTSEEEKEAKEIKINSSQFEEISENLKNVKVNMFITK
jgi:orotate phosphoribosyltransferase-like protein